MVQLNKASVPVSQAWPGAPSAIIAVAGAPRLLGRHRGWAGLGGGRACQAASAAGVHAVRARDGHGSKTEAEATGIASPDLGGAMWQSPRRGSIFCFKIRDSN